MSTTDRISARFARRVFGERFLNRPVISSFLLVAFAAVFSPPSGAFGQQAVGAGQRCLAIELYVRSGDEKAAACVQSVRSLIAQRPGLKLKVYDLDQGPAAGDRLAKIAKVYQLDAAATPVLYGLNRAISVPKDRQDDMAIWGQRVDELVQVELFTRPGCSRCTNAKLYLSTFRAKYPALRVQTYDVIADPASNQRFAELSRSQKIGGISFPGLWVAGQLVVGFEGQSGAARWDQPLKKWSHECKSASGGAGRVSRPRGTYVDRRERPEAGISLVSFRAAADSDDDEVGPALPLEEDAEEEDAFPALDIDQSPDDGDSLAIDSIDSQAGDDPTVIDLPWIGQISAIRLGMPMFTILIGLVDGFNPCAMWVLLFLLSILVNLKDRWKILAVAGTFVLISGVAYFAFMAAWLNVLLMVGFLREVQILLAVLAISVGAIHIKDFFAFKQGLSLSIPESAKPGIYARVRKIVTAESLVGAIAGASVLAVLVNFIELLCTAGLPALYSQVLMMQDFPAWKNYAYLGLYIAAYMFDDALMVGLVVVTLGKRKLQENEGRWLKLVSGLVILLLGVVLLVRPQWLGS
jgi:glutaredoxin